MSNEQLNLIENKLNFYIERFKNSQFKNFQTLINSMQYSLMAGGKRIRPTLTLEFCKLCGGNIKDALPFACAVEMIHTYSLIHDDLPCMDDDDLRRGRPSNHIEFDECTALLAGDALQSLAFEIMLENADENNSLNIIKASHYLAKYCGITGMVGGQVIDIALENMDKDNINIEIIEEMYQRKTGALLTSACVMGTIIGGGTEKEVEATTKYAKSIGLAFQIVDDILDLTQTTDKLGKPAKSDEKNNKTTLVTIMGIEKAKTLVNKLTQDAINALNEFSGDSSKLLEIAKELETREF